MLCNTCGAENRPTDRFCVGCGSSLAVGARGVAPPPAPVGRGFFASLFDTGFTSFVTPMLIRVVYVLVMIALVLTWVIFTIVGFHAGSLVGLASLVGGPSLC